MSFTAKELASEQKFLSAVLRCAKELIVIYLESPRIASIFAAQQRWLMAHAGFALYYGLPGEKNAGLYSTRFVDFIVKHDIASRNTAVAFIQEMLAYKFLRPVPDLADRRTRLLEPTATTHEHFVRWLGTHLMILDALDGGSRVQKLAAAPASFAEIQPRIANAILATKAVRDPGPTFNLFNWANSGGVVMDYLISRIDVAKASEEKIAIGPVSMREISERFLISTTHLKRLLKQAGSMDSVGWTGVPGKSSFWVSSEFVREYWHYQAAKFAIIDVASEAVLGR